MIAYDFTKEWEDLDLETKTAFINKCKEIEEQAIRVLANQYNVDYSTVVNVVTPLDPEGEWYSTNPERGLPNDINWIDFEIQFMKEELMEANII